MSLDSRRKLAVIGEPRMDALVRWVVKAPVLITAASRGLTSRATR